jgi:hypothetical protein
MPYTLAYHGRTNSNNTGTVFTTLLFSSQLTICTNKLERSTLESLCSLMLCNILAYFANGTVHFKKGKQLFEYQHLLDLRDI